ncbi:MAG: hypothetical protein M0P71_14715 [Melioribacteraceae bacterium]|jgi:hypothetical protein|nr:hypothetical protein [Melioribacteraceae bacterium]
MRYLPGINPEISTESISSYSLVQQGINNPDYLPTIFELYNEDTPFSTLLNMKGLKTRGLFDGMMSKKVRVVGSNHVQYAIPTSDIRKCHFKVNAAGVTYESTIYATEPGKNQSAFYVYLDSNWFGPNEIIELNDNQTQLFIYDTALPVEVASGCWRYEVKLLTKDTSEYANVVLFEDGSECGIGNTAYEHDFSETGNEKHQFGATWGHAYMTLQRVKMSYSGTAEAMKMSKLWTESRKGVKTYLLEEEDKMMAAAARLHEYALVFGKSSVTVDGTVVLHNKLGKEIITGDGVMNQGDGAYDYPYNTVNMKMIEGLMQDVDLRVGKDGTTEVAIIAGQKFISGFSKLMRESGFVTQNNNVEGSGSEKGVNNSYAYYEVDGVRIVPKRWRYLDGTNTGRPTKMLSDNTPKSSWDGYVVPLGQTQGGENQVELVQLRKPTMGTISGINKGGEMATSVDGTSKHFLFQTGVISRTKVTRIFRPYNS